MRGTNTFWGRVRQRWAWIKYDLRGLVRPRPPPTVYRYAGYGEVWEAALENPREKKVIWPRGGC